MLPCIYSLLGCDGTEDVSTVAKVLCTLVQKPAVPLEQLNSCFRITQDEKIKGPPCMFSQ